MTAKEFCYWLQGLFELQDPEKLGESQTDMIKAHLKMVFVHEIDPSYPAKQQNQLSNVHNNSVKFEPDEILMRC